MLNSGAIMISAIHTTLVAPEIDIHEKFEFVQKYFGVIQHHQVQNNSDPYSFILQRIAGGEHVGFSNPIFMSERAHAHRNFALTYHMMENKSFPPGYDVNAGLDMYFQVK